ncbi:unnamed protein product [Ceratitis capitata]|uniref:(Mediterranean fruit fly) hypothetical protein n=1 Tax=Ceratitis capitata TaxID=7213 RepID=A0A811VIL6_CERCA|nr:unnamed protein product [Ceratitis capitata]
MHLLVQHINATTTTAAAATISKTPQAGTSTSPFAPPCACLVNIFTKTCQLWTNCPMNNEFVGRPGGCAEQ